MRAAAVVLCLAVSLAAAPPWSKKDSGEWSDQEIERILYDSPWAQPSSATLSTRNRANAEPVGPVPGAAQAGMATPGGAGAGRWDGGVGRAPGVGALPTIPVTIRWDSALPIREALTRLGKVASGSFADVSGQYVITIIGLVPAGQYSERGRFVPRSQTDDMNGEPRSKQDPEQMLQGLTGSTRLRVRGHDAIAPVDVKLDADSGELHFLFPRGTNISEADKEVLFTARFGPMTIEKRFRLKDMRYKGKLEL